MTGSARTTSQRSVICRICKIPVTLETCIADERGESVHEECYVRKTISRFRTTSVVRLSENWFGSVIVRIRSTLRA
jgi:hypothetical protein